MGDATAREYYAAIHGVVQNFSSLPKVHHKNKATKLVQQLEAVGFFDQGEAWLAGGGSQKKVKKKAAKQQQAGPTNLVGLRNQVEQLKAQVSNQELQRHLDALEIKVGSVEELGGQVVSAFLHHVVRGLIVLTCVVALGGGHDEAERHGEVRQRHGVLGQQVQRGGQDRTTGSCPSGSHRRGRGAAATLPGWRCAAALRPCRRRRSHAATHGGGFRGHQARIPQGRPYLRRHLLPVLTNIVSTQGLYPHRAPSSQDEHTTNAAFVQAKDHVLQFISLSIDRAHSEVCALLCLGTAPLSPFSVCRRLISSMRKTSVTLPGKV